MGDGSTSLLVEFTIAGQAAGDGSQAVYLVVGGAANALATLNLRLAPTAGTLAGTLRLFLADGIVQDADISLQQATTR